MTTEIVRASRAAPPPQTLDSQIRFAQLLSDADLLPKQFVGKPANVLYAIEYGRTLGIAPVAAITGIHVIEGKPSASSGLIGALVRQAGHKLRVKSDGGTTATAQIVRSDDPEFTYEATWTLERAVQAGLCKLVDGKPLARDRNGKPTAWEKYPAAMLKARAITEVARDACEDVLFGLHYTPEELGAVIDQDGNPIDASVQPLRVVRDEPVVAATVFEAHAEAQAIADQAAKASHRGTWRVQWAAGAEAGLMQAPVLAPDTNQSDELGAYLTRHGKTLPDVPQTEVGGDQEDVHDAEVVEDQPDSEHAAAVAELLAFAAEAGLDDIHGDAEGALGLPLADASANAIRNLLAQLRGAA